MIWVTTGPDPSPQQGESDEEDSKMDDEIDLYPHTPWMFDTLQQLMDL